MKKLSLGLILVSILNSTVLAYENRYSIEQEYAIINSCIGVLPFTANKQECICALKLTQKIYPYYENSKGFNETFDKNLNYCEK